jgi:DNA-binding PadR family transcriptional regulator
MVLQTLDTLGPQHGYSIAARLEQFSAGALRINLGTLYPGLRRLEQRGLVRARWDVTDTNRKARSCAITAAGGHQLATEKAEWDRSSSIVHTLLREHDKQKRELEIARAQSTPAGAIAEFTKVWRSPARREQAHGLWLTGSSMPQPKP